MLAAYYFTNVNFQKLGFPKYIQYQEEQRANIDFQNKRMQLQQNIIQAFGKKGYFVTSVITKRQFHILMNSLMSQTKNIHRLFNENITSQIWKQTQDRVEKVQKGQKQIKTENIINTMVDAIQILTNRILECQQRTQELLQKRKKLEEQMNYVKIQSVQGKIDVLRKDLQQFGLDFKMLTQPFLSDVGKGQLKRQMSIQKRKSLIEKTGRLEKDFAIPANQFQKFEQHMKQKFQRRPVQSQSVDKSSLNEQKKCALYFLIFLMVLEITVCLLKFNFVNLIVFLIGFLVLMEDKYMPSMMKIAFGTCLGTVPLDGLWLFFYSDKYLNSYLNSGLPHQFKAFFQYIWFITLLQVFLKIIYIYFIRQYQAQSQILRQLQIKDSHIQQVRILTKQKQQNQNNNNNSRFRKKTGNDDDQVTVN